MCIKASRPRDFKPLDGFHAKCLNFCFPLNPWIVSKTGYDKHNYKNTCKLYLDSDGLDVINKSGI